jgi:hypothetical protein
VSTLDDLGPAIDAREQLRRWDSGESIWSIEMGGLGPGYEQAIQILAIEIIRDEIDNTLPVGKFDGWGDKTVERIDARDPVTGKYGCGGFSGAQVGAAKQIAYRFIKDGPRKALEGLEGDRTIQVYNFWPRAPQSAHVERGPSPEAVDSVEAKI